MPPTRWKSSPRYSPAGWQFTSSGISWPIVLPVVEVERHTHVAGDGDQVRWTVAGSADRRCHDDGILEGLARHDLAWLEILLHHGHDAVSGGIGDLAAFAMGSGDSRAARQGHPQGFGDAVHGQRRAHGVAMTDAGSGSGGALHELLVVDLARGEQLAVVPDDGTGTGPLALEPAIEHGSSGQHNGWQIHRRRRHQTTRRRLVAPRGQHYPVQGIAVKNFHQPQIRQVAVEPGSGALAGFLQGVHREFQRNTTGIADAVLDPRRQFQVMAIAGHEIASGLGDANDRASRLQLLAGQTVVQVALHVERGHVGIMRVVEPELAAVPLLLAHG